MRTENESLVKHIGVIGDFGKYSFMKWQKPNVNESERMEER